MALLKRMSWFNTAKLFCRLHQTKFGSVLMHSITKHASNTFASDEFRTMGTRTTNITKITRLAIPRFWSNVRSQILPIKWRHECERSQKFSPERAPFWAPSWRHLMGKTSFPWSSCICQNPGIANLLFQLHWLVVKVHSDGRKIYCKSACRCGGQLQCRILELFVFFVALQQSAAAPCIFCLVWMSLKVETSCDQCFALGILQYFIIK